MVPLLHPKCGHLPIPSQTDSALIVNSMSVKLHVVFIVARPNSSSSGIQSCLETHIHTLRLIMECLHQTCRSQVFRHPLQLQNGSIIWKTFLPSSGIAALKTESDYHTRGWTYFAQMVNLSQTNMFFAPSFTRQVRLLILTCRNSG